MEVGVVIGVAYMVIFTVLCVVKQFHIGDLEARLQTQTERADRWKADHEKLMVIYGDACRKMNTARKALDISTSPDVL